MPQSKSTELCSSAPVVPQSKSTELCTRRPLCHKVNLPRCEARRRRFIMTCDIFGTGQTNILGLSYLFGKTYKQVFFAQMTSSAVRYDVIYHSFPISSQYFGHFVFAYSCELFEFHCFEFCT